MRYREDDRRIMTHREGEAMDRWITGNYGEDSVPKDIVCSLAGEGAQWDAWVKQYPDKRWVVWECPDCGMENVDSPDLTATPMCGDCGAEFDWWDFECLEEGGSNVR